MLDVSYLVMPMQEGERLAEEAHQKAKGGWGGSGVGPELRKSVDFTLANVQQALDKANEQNTQLYFDTVPRGVPDITAASLVQPVRPEGEAYDTVVCAQGCGSHISAATEKTAPAATG